MNITVIGTGYVGLVSAVVLADIGHTVTCVDIDKVKIDRLEAGEPVIFEEGLADMMKKNKSRLIYTNDMKTAYKEPDVIFICVGTPEKEDGSANIEYVYSAVDDAIKNIHSDVVMVIKSTVPIGTNDKIQQYIDEHQKNKFKIEIVSNPEFLSQGTAVKNMMHADRIIIGADNEKPQKIMRQVYENLNTPIIYTDRCSAEMIKYASNDFLALKISYINEIANLCELLGANIRDVARGMGMDPRIGNRFLNAGIGYGGSCFPKDTKALYSLAKANGYEMKTVKAAIEVNKAQKLRLIEKSKQYYDSLNGLIVAVLGLTFKPGTDDLREAPSLVNVPEILKEGAAIQAWDSVGIENFKITMQNNEDYDEKKITYYNSPSEALVGADICFIFTEWDEVKALRTDDFLRMRKPIILDGRNCFEQGKFECENIKYSSIGSKEY